MATSTNPKTCHVANLIQLSFYFCLKYLHYTKYIGNLWKVQFQTFLGFLFLDGVQLLLDDSSIQNFHHATHIVLTLDKQKNAIRGEYVPPSIT